MTLLRPSLVTRRPMAGVLLATALVLPLGLSTTADAQARRGGGGDRQMERGQDGQRAQQDRRRGGQANFGGWNRQDDSNPFGRMGRMMGGMQSLARPSWERRDLQVLVRELDLDEDQALIIELLLADYLDAFQALGEQTRDSVQELMPQPPQMDEAARQEFEKIRQDMREMRDRVRAMQESGESEDAVQQAREQLREDFRARMQQMREAQGGNGDRGRRGGGWMGDTEEMSERTRSMGRIFDGFLRERRALDDAFSAELGAMLTEGQLTILPAVEQTVRREKRLPNGRLSGESIDLSRLVREAGLADDAAILDEVWPAYFDELDRAMIARDDHTEQLPLAMMAAFSDEAYEDLLEITRTEARLRESVRDVNRRYLDITIGTLMDAGFSAESANELVETYRTEAFGRIYRATRTDRAFDAVLEIEDLDPEVAAHVEELRTVYAAELMPINRELERLTVETEGQQIVSRIEGMVERLTAFREGGDRERGDRTRGRGNPWGADENIVRLYEQRGEIDQRYRGLIEQVLTPEQIEQLPQQRRGWGGRGGDANGEDARRGGERGARGGERGERGDRGARGGRGGDAEGRARGNGGRRGGDGG